MARGRSVDVLLDLAPGTVYTGPDFEMDGASVRVRLMARGITVITFQLVGLEGGPLRVPLPVEDDAEFLADSLPEVRRLVAGQPTIPAPFVVILDDGILALEHEIVGSNVAVNVRHCPHLDRRFRRDFKIELPGSRYLDAWRHAVAALVAAAQG